MSKKTAKLFWADCGRYFRGLWAFIWAACGREIFSWEVCGR